MPADKVLSVIGNFASHLSADKSDSVTAGPSSINSALHGSIALTPLAIEAMPQMRQGSAWPVLILIAHIALYMALPLCAWFVGGATRAENCSQAGTPPGPS